MEKIDQKDLYKKFCEHFNDTHPTVIKHYLNNVNKQKNIENIENTQKNIENLKISKP